MKTHVTASGAVARRIAVGLRHTATAARTLALPFFLVTSSEAADLSHEQFRYQLAMSADDALCKPLTSVFNQLLEAALKDPKKERQLTDGPPLTNFEVTHPEAFAAAGLYEPKPVGEPVIGRKFYRFDALGNGEQRVVSVHDIDQGVYPQSYLDILARGASPDTVTWPTNGAGKKYDTELPNALLDGNIDVRFLIDTQKQTLSPSITGGYALKKWENFDKMFKEYNDVSLDQRIARNLDFPILGGVATARPYTTKDGQVYILLDEYMRLPPRDVTNVMILVYSVSSNTPKDTCYIVMKPTQFSKKFLGDSK